MKSMLYHNRIKHNNHCNICNSLIARSKMDKHQETCICKQKALLLTEPHIDEETQLKEKQKSCIYLS